MRDTLSYQEDLAVLTVHESNYSEIKRIQTTPKRTTKKNQAISIDKMISTFLYQLQLESKPTVAQSLIAQWINKSWQMFIQYSKQITPQVFFIKIYMT